MEEDEELDLETLKVKSDLKLSIQSCLDMLAAARNEKDMQKQLGQLRKQYEELAKSYRNELMLRRSLHNYLQELKGNIRVLCRIRPILAHERGRKKEGGTAIVKVINQQKVFI